MDIGSVLSIITEYFQNFDGAKALQIAYYSVALVLASIGLWKTILYAEGNMPKRLVEFASRFEGRIVEKSINVLGRIKRYPHVLETNDYFDVSAEIDRAVGYLDKNDPRRAASELHDLATRLENKVKVAEAQLALTKQQAASVQLFFGALAQKLPERADQSLTALRKAAELRPDVPEIHKEIGIVERAAGGFQKAIAAFNEYWKAANALDESKRSDKKLLIIDSYELAAECHRKLSEPDKERDELKFALEVAGTINDAILKPHAVKARLLDALGENAKNRNPPQRGNMEKFFAESAAEFTLAGLPDEAARVLEKKNMKSAA